MFNLLRPIDDVAAYTHGIMQLSPTELQVTLLICSGLSNDEIATVSGKTVSTVVAHVTHILHKTGTRSRAHLCRIVIELGCSDPIVAARLEHGLRVKPSVARHKYPRVRSLT